MNAEAYLRKQGWQGSGHSLDSTGRGIKKPLLISHKQDQLGLGKKKAAHTTDDQWWMRAFDASLKTIGSGKESTLSQIRTQGINRGGLYGFFVRGEQIEGTIDDPSATTTDASAPQSGTNTPPTSASDTETPAPKPISDKKNKRKRAEAEVDAPGISEKKSKRVKSKKEEAKAESTEHNAVAAKLAKLKPAEKAEYETRAAAKNQTLEQYVLRRIQKKATKHTTEPAQGEAEAEAATKNPPLFFTDLGGDPELVNAAPDTKQQAQSTKATAVEQDQKASGHKSKGIIHKELRQQKQEKKAARRAEKAAKKAAKNEEKQPAKPKTAGEGQAQNATKKESKRIVQPEPVDDSNNGTEAEFISIQQPATLKVKPTTPTPPEEKTGERVHKQKQKRSKAQKAEEKKARLEKKAAKKKLTKEKQAAKNAARAAKNAARGQNVGKTQL